MNRAKAYTRILLPGVAIMAAVTALQAEAVGEEAGGVLTSSFSIANYLGVLLLTGGGLVALLWPRRSWWLCCIGAALICPMQTWRIAPGLWCVLGDCSAVYVRFALKPIALLALAIALLTCVLAIRLRNS